MREGAGDGRHGIVVLLRPDEALVEPSHIDILVAHLRAKSLSRYDDDDNKGGGIAAADDDDESDDCDLI